MPPSSKMEGESIANPRTSKNGAALVFGASGVQGRNVIQGLLDSGDYFPIYGANDDATSVNNISESNKGLIFNEVDWKDYKSVERVLTSTQAQSIFLVTKMEIPPDVAACGSLKEAEEREYHGIVSFFDALVSAFKKDNIPRHVVFSTFDDVQDINDNSRFSFIQPLEDGSMVAHYSGKGRGGKYALKFLDKYPDITITLLTLPFLHANFFASTIPLPNEGRTQWTISACFGDAKIDMLSVSDLAYIVPSIFEDKDLYDGFDLRVTAERISMEEIASTFSDIFGKDIIYNPLSVEEMAAIPVPAAGSMAQMCSFLSDSRSNHDLDITEAVMFPRKPQLFKDWLLANSDNKAFDQVGLTTDPSPILIVTVFGATGMQGKSVVKGLLNDKRKRYQIRATSRDISQGKALDIKALDPERITLVEANFDDTESCSKAVGGADGVFLVTDFHGGAAMDPVVEERHARNVIDACESCSSVKHLVFSTLESIDQMNTKLKMNLPVVTCPKTGRSSLAMSAQFDAKARAAAYARTKKVSVTYVLMPCYAEHVVNMLRPELVVDGATGNESLVISVPNNDELEGEARLMCMSVEDLGPAVANIFDSYQVYAGHEIGLVTNYISVSEAAEIIKEVFYSEQDVDGNTTTRKVTTKKVTKKEWLESRGTFAKDLGNMFSYYAKSNAVQKRRSVAKTLQLVPDARPLKLWLEQNRDNVAFRSILGLE